MAEVDEVVLSEMQVAAAEALKPVEHLEDAVELEKLREKVCFHMRKAGKKVEVFTNKLADVANAMADLAFNSIFTSLGEKEWLTEVDLVPVFALALRERFPKHAKAADFDETVQAAVDKAVDEKNFESVLWEAVQIMSQDKRIRNKVYEVIEAARNYAKLAFAQAGDAEKSLDSFVAAWIRHSVNSLRASSGGEPEKFLSVDSAVTLFATMVEKGGVPKSIIAAFGEPPTEWPIIASTVAESFLEASAEEPAVLADDGLGEPLMKRARGRSEGYGRAAPTSLQAAMFQAQVKKRAAYGKK